MRTEQAAADDDGTSFQQTNKKFKMITLTSTFVCSKSSIEVMITNNRTNLFIWLLLALPRGATKPRWLVQPYMATDTDNETWWTNWPLPILSQASGKVSCYSIWICNRSASSSTRRLMSISQWLAPFEQWQFVSKPSVQVSSRSWHGRCTWPLQLDCAPSITKTTADVDPISCCPNSSTNWTFDLLEKGGGQPVWGEAML